MDNLARLNALNSIQKFGEERTIVFHPVSPYVNNHNTKTQLLEIVFMLKAPINCYQNIASILRMSNQFDIRNREPLCFCDGQDFMPRKSLPQAGIDTFV